MTCRPCCSPGRRLGLVGPSGSGKSTLAALLLRFLDPVSRDGHPTAAWTCATWPSTTYDASPAWSTTTRYVFATTSLAENVRLARPAGDGRRGAGAALRDARLGPWLDELPEGLDTLERRRATHQVSGGERARLAIARAILADQPVLVLDEPTAHLDTSTAQAVADDLLTASGGRSVLWITHGTVGLEAMDHVVRLVGEPDGERVSRVP